MTLARRFFASRGSVLYRIGASIISILIALAIGGLVIYALGRNPFLAIYSLFGGAFATSFGIGSDLNLAAVLLLTGLAAVLAYTGRIWNFGMEGQLYIGGLAAIAVLFGLLGLGPLVIPLALVAGTVAGGLYAALAGALKVKLNVNEVVSTILLNYVALLVVDYVAGGPLHNQQAVGFNTTPTIPARLSLPTFPGSTVQPSIVIATLIAIGAAFLIKKTKFGFELRMMGANYRAAEYVGIKTGRKVMLTMLLSGSLAGLGGSMLTLGISHAMFMGISNFYGWLGVPVGLLASLDPVGAIFSAVFFATLNTGSIAMQSVAGVRSEVAQMISAIIVIVLLVRTLLEKLMLSHGV